MSTDTQREAALLHQALKTHDLLVAGMSYMAPGFSFFFTTALIVSTAGAQAPIAFLLAGVGVLATGAAFAEFSRMAPSAGSLQVFVERGFGRTFATAAGLVLLAGYVCLQGGVLALFGGWTSHLIQVSTGVSIAWPVLSMVGLIITTALMIRGVGISIRATLVLFLIEFALTSAVCIVVLARGGDAGFSAVPFDVIHPAAGWNSIALAMVFCVFSFVGFEGSVSFAEETPDPRRALPIAVIGGIVVMAALYLIGTYAAIIGFGVDHIKVLGADSAPIATLATRYAAPLKPLLEVAVFTSIAANLMAAGNANARILFNMGREKVIYRRLGTVNSRYRTPIVALVTFMLATGVLCLLGAANWDYLTAFGSIAGLGSFLALLIYMLATAALPVYIWRRGERLRIWAHIIIPALGTAIWLVPLWGSLKPGQAFPASIYPFIVLGIAAGAAVYSLVRRRSFISIDVADKSVVEPVPDNADA